MVISKGGLKKMTDSKEEKKLTPPYLSYRTFINFLEKLKVGMPSRIDRSVMGSFSGAAQAQIFPALKYLHLINPDDTPTEKLTSLVSSEGTEKQKILKDMIIVAYPFLFKDGIDLKRMTASHLQELFDKAGASGATARKSITFFMAAAKNTGIELSPHLKIRGAIRNSGKGKKTKIEKIERDDIEHEEREVSQQKL
jgi:hypothetical protein